MTFKKNGVNFSNIFEPKGSATKISNVGFKEGGSDISNLYYPLSLGGTSPSNTNYKKNGIDLAALFANKGSVSYFNSITFGSETVFNFKNTQYISITKLDDTHICIAYQDCNNSYRGAAIVGTVSGNNITFGSETVFNPGITMYISITKLDDTHVCIVYQNQSYHYYGTAVVGTVSGNSITFGSKTVFNSRTTYYISITKLDDTHVCIAYQDYTNSRCGAAIIGTVSGNSITFGSEKVFNSGNTTYVSVTKLDDTHVCIAYTEYTNSNYGTAVVGTVSGNSIAFGTETVFNSGYNGYISITALDNTYVCIAYRDGGNSSYGTTIIGTVSGNSITFGTKTVFNAGDTTYISITTLDATHVCVVYQDVNNFGYGTAIIGTVNGNSITFGSEIVFNPGDTYYTSITALDNAHACITYEDRDNSSYGTAIIGSFS